MILFALYRDLTGIEALDLDVDRAATARDAVAVFRRDVPGAERIPAEPTVAVNQVYVQLDTALNEGDEVALLPPVAGG